MIERLKKILGIEPKPLAETEEFQPDAIMLETHEPPVPLHIVWFLIIALLLFMLGWASCTKIDKIVSADGKVVTSRQPITMKPLELTTISQVHVRTGQKVKKGDILFTFDQTMNVSELKGLREQMQSYTANRERLRAELDAYVRDPVLPASPNADQLQQQTIYMARKNYYRQKLREYEETARRYQVTVDSLEETMKKYVKRKEMLDTIEKMYTDLHGKNATSLKDLLEVQVEVVGTAIQVDQQKVSIVESRQSLLATQAERDAFISDWKRQIVEDLVTVERSIISLQSDIKQREMLVNNTQLRAPCDAVVHELAPFQEGSAVREAEALVTLIPLDVEYEAEIDIPAKDISWIKLHDKCRLKFDTFPFQQCGTLDGEILYISQDAFERGKSAGMDDSTDDGGQLSAAARGVSYQARLKISGKFTGTAENASIIPGMRLKAEVKVGKRTILNYIFNPFMKALDSAIREP